MKLPAKLTRQRTLAILIALSVLSSLLGNGLADRLRAALHPIFAPLGDAGMYLATAFREHVHSLSGPSLTPAEAQKLIDANRELEGRLLSVERELADRIQRQQEMHTIMSQLFGPVQDLPCELISARVVAADSLPYGRRNVLNVGRRQGAEPGVSVTTLRVLTDRSKALPANLAAITQAALVGRLTETGAFTARLQLVTDMGFKTPARIRRIVKPGVRRTVTIVSPSGASDVILTPEIENRYPVKVEARGNGVDRLIVEGVSALHNVQKGDFLVTSGDDPFLPAEIRIGEVVSVVDAEQPNFVTLRVQPHADLATLREVYIVVPKSGKSASAGGT